MTDELALLRALFAQLPRCACGAIATRTAHFSMRNGGGTSQHCDVCPMPHATMSKPLPYVNEVRALLELQNRG